MKKRYIILIGICLTLVSMAYVSVRGTTYTVTADVPVSVTDAEAVDVVMESSDRNPDVSPTDILRIEQKKISGGKLSVKLRAVGRGKVFVKAISPDGYYFYNVFYVHPTGFITANSYNGPSTGGVVIPVAAAIFLVTVLYALIARLREEIRVSYYQYKNVTYLALILFTSFLLLEQILSILHYQGLIHTIEGIISSANLFAQISLPLVLIVSAYVTVSNIRLLMKEGRNWHNMLGCMLGILMIAGILLPVLVSNFLQNTMVVDVHNERGAAMYIESMLSSTFSMVIAYLECVLVGTVVFAVKAARHIPAFDKDYILILGCQIRKDGTLTKLLQSRADRAVEFARMQREASGKELTFVPSGGQGSDEVMPEAQAIRNYLLGIGIPDERILPEDKSVNTLENLKNSMELIGTHSDVPQPKVAFSTTNYHVFRAGMFAAQQGFRMDGIGSPTRSYFWINAFIREFIATLVSERKTHAVTVAVLAVLMVIMVYMMYVSHTL